MVNSAKDQRHSVERISDKNVDINVPHQTVACDICLSEIPSSLALTFDGPDYVYYFCGLDCLGRWEAKQKQ